ncbi:MAG: hypothetical protein CMH84_14175 [Nocardioides sp.]|nr:hypothetical protein [Nocardioides sp.]
MASRKITTRTSFDRIIAITNVAQRLSHVLVWSQLAPARAIGAKTIAMRRSALRIRRLIQTTIAPMMARLARNMVRMAPAPGAPRLMAPSPAASTATLSPISFMLVPAALTMPMQSWSVISSAVASSASATNDPRIDFASPSAALDRAAGSRRIMPPMTWSMKKPSITKTPTPNMML